MADTLQRRFGRRCRCLRENAGLTQLDMVRHHGFNLSHYQKIERGALSVRLVTMAHIATAFGVQMSTLLDGVTLDSPVQT